jgi:HIRAN domain
VSFLRRLVGGQHPTWPPPGPIVNWPDGKVDIRGHLRIVTFDPARKTVDVVGEGSYQGSLERLAGARTIDGAREPDHIAILLPEPNNPYDPNAVRIVVVREGGDAAVIGYLSRGNAVAYRPVIDRLAADGKVAACRASISGGWDRGDGDRGSFGVRLSMGTPDELVAELDAD